MPGNPLTDDNWANDVSEQIITLVGNVRDKTTNNAIKGARWVVFGLLILVLVPGALVLLIVGFTRFLQEMLDFAVAWDKAVWISYLGMGGILTLAGWLVMRKRHSTSS